MGQFVQVTPFMHVANLETAVDFFVGTLGFSIPYRVVDYAYVEREGCGVRIMKERGEDVPGPGSRAFRYYFDVRDVDALYAELKPALDKLPPDDVHGPADKPYRQRELLVLAPDGDLVAFGSPINS